MKRMEARRAMSRNLLGLRVLVVEDEYMIAQMIAEILERAGCVVIGPESDLDAALHAVRHKKIDGVLLDINLGGTLIFPLADQLDANKVPYLFVTGYGPYTVPDRFRNHPLIAKPFMPHVLLQTLQDVAAKGDRFNPATP